MDQEGSAKAYASAEALLSPVNPVDGEGQTIPEKGVALCLSGGGYRAMLFHLGALWRLNELATLPKLDRISSVSGGSITAGLLGLRWTSLLFRDGVAANFVPEVVSPLRNLANHTIDVPSVLFGLFSRGAALQIAKRYRRYLFGDSTLQDLPAVRPRFVINATNVQSKALFRFSRPYLRDWRVGEIKQPRIELAKAVAASSAFPPMLSPLQLDLRSADFTADTGFDLQREPFTSRAVLTDGGVYDNLGLETAWKRYDTILVSDGGGVTPEEENPARNWLWHMMRVGNIVDNQVRNLRKRQVVGSYKAALRKGAYWSIWQDSRDFKVTTPLECPVDKTKQLARMPTRLRRLGSAQQERLINWGYAITDAGMRAYGGADIASAPTAFPYPSVGVG